MRSLDFIKKYQTSLLVAISMTICMLFIIMTVYLCGNYIGLERIEDQGTHTIFYNRKLAKDNRLDLSQEQTRQEFFTCELDPVLLEEVDISGDTKEIVENRSREIDCTGFAFSFDGEKAGQIVLGVKSEGQNFEYSLDGQKTWTEIHLPKGNERLWPLAKEEIATINSSDGIYLHVVGTEFTEKYLYKIEILEGLHPEIYIDDFENSVLGTTPLTEWRYLDEEEWFLYDAIKPNLEGDTTIVVRNRAHDNVAASKEISLSFTSIENDGANSYVSNKYFSIEKDDSAAANIIDGRFDTIWQSAIDEDDDKKYITIAIDHPIYLTKVAYYPRRDEIEEGRIRKARIEVSMEGEVWEVVKESDWLGEEALETAVLDVPAKAKFVRLTALDTVGNCISIAELFLFEDANTLPVAEVEYSTMQYTNEDVTATLQNISEGAKILSDGGSNVHNFTQNGNFTFLLEDERTGTHNRINTGVYNIDKTTPTGFIRYSKTEQTTEAVVASLYTSEFVTVTSAGGATHIFEKNGTHTFTFIDRAGNEGEVTALVTWIEEAKPIAPSEENPNKTDGNSFFIRPPVANPPTSQGQNFTKPNTSNTSTDKIDNSDDIDSEDDDEEGDGLKVDTDPTEKEKEEDKKKSDKEIIEDQKKKSNFYAAAIFIIGLLVSAIIILMGRKEKRDDVFKM